MIRFNLPAAASSRMPRTTRRLLRPLFAASALCAAFAAMPAFAHASAPAPAVPKIAWAPCGDGFDGAECATVKVPLDYDHPNGAKTDIAIARVPASDPKNRIGSLFLNPGGPGGSGVDLVLFGYGEFLNQVLGGRFDIVGWDPRGIGASTPIQCWDSNEARDAYFGASPFFPYRPAQERPFYELNRNIARLCFDRRQPILQHMSTADVVRDLDLLRQAVGDARLNYIGYSYGSHIGNTYANMYPSKVRALVIDGVLNPVLWTGGWQIQADRDASFKVLKEFFRQCDAAAAQCVFSGGAGARARFNALLSHVRTTPILVDDGGQTVEIGYDYFTALSASMMYAPERWPLYSEILALLEQAAAGDRGAASRALGKVRAMESSVRQAMPRRAVYENGTEAYLGNHCSDAEYPAYFQLYSLIGKYAEAGSFQGPFWWWGNTGCAAWPTSDDRYVGPWLTRTSSPALVIGNYFDPATDYAGAVASSHLLTNSRLLSYAGWGHVASYTGRSQCVDDYVTQYLLDGTLPPRGTVCPAARNPFATTVAKAKATMLPMVGLPDLKPLRGR